MHDGMQCDPIQGEGHKPLKVVSRIFDHFQRLSLPPFIVGAGNFGTMPTNEGKTEEGNCLTQDDLEKDIKGVSCLLEWNYEQP